MHISTYIFVFSLRIQTHIFTPYIHAVSPLSPVCQDLVAESLITWGTVYGVGFMNSVRSIMHSLSSWETWMLCMGGKRGYASLKSFSWSFLWVRRDRASSTNTCRDTSTLSRSPKTRGLKKLNATFFTLCFKRTMSWERRMRPQSLAGCGRKDKWERETNDGGGTCF